MSKSTQHNTRVDSNGTASSIISSVPVNDVIVRERTFTIAQLREDFRDAQTQFLVILTQLHDENFTGSLQLHFSAGRILHVKTQQKQKIV